jgi:two-component system sensor histidine kinase AgrC
MKFLELYVGGIILWIVFYKMGALIFAKKRGLIITIFTILIFSVILAMINYSDTEIISDIIRMLTVYGLMLLFNKILYKGNFGEIVLGSLILFLTYVLSESIIALILSIIISFSGTSSLALLRNKLIINIIITTLAYIISFLEQKKFISIIKENKYNNKSNIIITTLILTIIVLLFVRIPMNQWKFNIEFIVTMAILIGFSAVGFLMLKQKADIEKTTSKYQKLVDYSDITNNLLEDYRVASHEQKNQLLVIRSLLDDNSSQELVDYVDGLLDKKVGFKYEWIGDLNHLPLSGLKGLINYKLIEAHTLDININISISKDVNNSNLNSLSTTQKDELYSIMGVYLDNAIQAAKESNKKEVSLEIYKENEKIVIVIANTYNGKIEMEKLDNYGYITKGKNHGVGLHLVKKIIENEVIYSQLRSLFEDYYVQKLIIDLSGIK